MPIEPSVVNGIRIRSMTVEDYKEVKLFLGRNYYTDDPLTMSGQNMQKCHEEKQDASHISMIEQDTCLLAIDENNGNTLVGVVLAGAQVPSDLHERRQLNCKKGDCYFDIHKLFLRIESEANVFERYGVSKVLYSHITNVEPSMRGKGLGRRLAATLMEVGRAKGFPLMTAYCSSFYSARQKEEMGMKVFYSLAYADYKNEQGEVVFKPPPPHTHIRIMVSIL